MLKLEGVRVYKYLDAMRFAVDFKATTNTTTKGSQLTPGSGGDPGPKKGTGQRSDHQFILSYGTKNKHS